MNLSIFNDYSFIIVLTGSVILGITSGIIGTVSVLKKQSLMGDVVGHSSFPGIVIAFMLFMTRSPFVLLGGAVFSGILAYFLIQIIDSYSPTGTNTILAIILSTFFGLGIVLKSYIQGNPNFSKASQSGLQNYIFGQAAYMTKFDIILIMAVSLFSLIILFLFYKEIQIYVFDQNYGNTLGYGKKKLSFLTLFITISVIAVGLKIVGIILISSMLISPAVSALQWSDKYSTVLTLSGIFGGISAFFGTFISANYKGMSTGPSIVIAMSIIVFISILLSPKGLIFKFFKKRKVN